MLVFVALFSLLFAVQAHAVWNSEGLKSSPSNGTILADTGPQANASTLYQVVCDATLNADVLIEQRNDVNNATLFSQQVSLAANDTKDVSFRVITLTDERIRVKLNGALTLGSVQCSIFDPF